MFFKFILNRKKKKINENIKKEFDIKKWMNLTKEERLKVDFIEKDESMKKKKALLKSIRDEYIKIKEKKSI